MAQRVIKRSGSVTHFTIVDGQVGFGTDAPDAAVHIVNAGGNADGSQNVIIEGAGRGSGIQLDATGTGGRSFSIYSGGTDEAGGLVIHDVTGDKFLAKFDNDYFHELAVLPSDADGLPQAPDAPAAGRVRFFVRDDGNGRVEQCTLFPSGALFTTHFEGYLEADFTTDVTTGVAPLTVQFTNTSRNESATPTYTWEKNPGDGWVPFDGTPTDENPSEVFDVGTWSIRFTNTRADGDSVKPVHGLIVATEPPPPGPGGVANLIRAARASDLVKPDGALISKIPAAYETATTFTSDSINRPVFHTDRTPAGGPSLTFDGTNDRLDFTGTGVLSEFHAFMVLRQTDNTISNQAILAGPVSNVLAVWQSVGPVTDSVVSNTTESGSISFGGTPRDTDWHIYELKVSGGVATRKVDGTIVGTTPTIAGTQAYTFSAVGDWPSGGAPWQGEWAETCLYSAALSDVNAALVRADLKADHGTP